MPRPAALLAALVLSVFALSAGRPAVAGSGLDPACVDLDRLTAAQKYTIGDLRAAVLWQNWGDASFSAQALKNADEPHAYYWFAWLILENHMRGDLTDAVARMRRVAEHGCPMAQVAYSQVFARGQGVPQDWTQAYKWAALAAGKGDAGGLKLRDEIARQHPDVVAEGTRLAGAYQPAAW
jgi:TPR repeat protein